MNTICVCDGWEWKAQGVKSRKAHMVGVVVVKWLIVAHQHHPNTHHQVLPKTTHSSHLCWLFHSWNHPLKEGKGWL